MDRKEFLESNLHVYDRDDTKITIYNVERWLKERREKKKMTREKNLRG